MKHFFTILRDSFREAVDGFVIYVMLVLSTILILLVASLSFTPEPADNAISRSIDSFQLFVPDKNNSESVQLVPGITYAAKEIVRSNDGQVNLRLEIKTVPNPFAPTTDDPLHICVASWLKSPPKPQKLKIPQGLLKGKEKEADEETIKGSLELVDDLKPKVSSADVAAVTEARIVEFLQGQFAAHMAIADAKVTKTTAETGVNYAYDCVLPHADRSITWPHRVKLIFGTVDVGVFSLGGALNFIESTIVNGYGAALTLLISVVLTAFFIPNLLRKGALDLIISKPIGRVALLLCKYIGGCSFIFIITAYTILGVWVALGLRSGNWSPHFLVVIPAITFTFALLYAMSTLVAVLTRSAIAAIIVTVAFAFGLYIVGQVKTFSDLNRAGLLAPPPWSDTVHSVIDGVNTALPRYKDMDKVTGRVISQGTQTIVNNRMEGLVLDSPSFFGTFGLSAAYIAAMLALASLRLVTRDG